MASNSVGIPLVGKGRLDPQLEVVKRAVTAYVKQAREGLPNGVWNAWGDICERLTKYKGPISNYIRGKSHWENQTNQRKPSAETTGT